MVDTLAVVIPAYKETFFAQALQSLANQTCKDFTVYIGDDASPHNLKAIADLFHDKLRIVYTRFEENTGAKNLVHQWQRCIALSKSEKWLWLFSDDDIADPSCVENFLKVVSQNKDRFEVYRFNTVVIDRNGEWMFDTPRGPIEESSAEMAYHLLKGERGNSMPDHIFTREVFDRNGGFVYTSYAQGSDWATSMLFSKEKGLAIIPDACVHWRYSGLNISSGSPETRARMVKGHIEFLDWVLRHFQYLKKASAPISFDMIKSAMRINIRNVFTHHYRGFTPLSLVQLALFMSVKMHTPLRSVIADLRAIDVHTGNQLGRVGRLKSKIRNFFFLKAS